MIANLPLGSECGCLTVNVLSIRATCYFTDGFADVAFSHDPKPFFLTLKANFDPRFGISAADLP